MILYDFYDYIIKELNSLRFAGKRSEEAKMFELILYMMGEETVNQWINYHYDHYKDKEFGVFFETLHKTLRQTDICDDVFLVRSLSNKQAIEINKDENEKHLLLKNVNWFGWYKLDEHRTGSNIDNLLWNMIHLSIVFQDVIEEMLNEIKEGWFKPMKHVKISLEASSDSGIYKEYMGYLSGEIKREKNCILYNDKVEIIFKSDPILEIKNKNEFTTKNSVYKIEKINN